MEPGSPESKRALRKYSESWVQAGDRVFVLGTAAAGGRGASMQIIHAGQGNPLLLSENAQDLTAGAFGRNVMVASLAGLGLGVLGVVFILKGLGVIWN